MPTVYAIQEPPPYIDRATGTKVEKDLSSAQRYGAIKFILDSRDRVGTMPGQARHKLAKGLQDFKPDDYLVHPGGDYLSLIIVGSILRDLGFREVQWLRWEKERGTNGERLAGGFYTPVTIPL